MSGYSQDNGFPNQPNTDSYPNYYYQTEYNQFQRQQLDFQPLESFDQVTDTSFTPLTYTDQKGAGPEDFDERPLLEELDIYPDRILEKVKAVLNPFRSKSLTDDAEYLKKDADLAGPIFFYLILAVSLFLSGNKTHIGYVYGITVLTSLLMYGLLTVMTYQDGVFTYTTVFSILGYSLSPIVVLSIIGILVSFEGILGVVLAIVMVFWCSLSASRLFVTMSGDKEQQPLIAYPCALVAGIYMLMVIF